ncbi:hypothetical protein [Cellulophaga sp. BC115SP]|jgi:glucan phosphoethanolaminetransferase (alkaline phosphatase superfamily)|uniref:hypothetical protein n=1 Tax=Cellulophaga sp. BC115SP TaxID=2683263 RepID=UPI001412A139|nr:hypothetical protein [Cellulophaga sp. BC115SP]NBB29021.1 hypothetical protein [Cellulophaga sp. BC115SP]
MKESLKEQRLFIISCLFLLLYNFPIISIFNLDTQIAGIPSLFLYVFVLWLILIIVIYLNVRELNKNQDHSNHDE